MTKQEVYETLRFEIVSNVIRPGEILNEKDLMERFKVGRSPIRDVLFKLQEEELLKTLPRLGSMVTPLDISEVRDLVELRRELEGFAGSLAAQRITDEQLEQLRAIIRHAEEDTPEHHEVNNITEYFDTRFHSILYDACGNRKLIKVLEGLHLTMLRIWFHMGYKAIEFSKQAETLHVVLEALEKRDPVKTRETMEAHVDLYAAKVREKFL